MIHSIQQELTLSVPLTLSAHQSAQRFYQRHQDPQKAKQVYLNTLAVEAVCTYLAWLGIKSNLPASDSWDPVVQTLANVADLELPGQGKLECRPVLPEEITCYIPPETNAGRIGYLPVLFDAALETATLLGFIPGENIDPETQEVSLSALHPLDTLFDRLKPQPSPGNQSTHLGQWLEGAVTSGWQTVEALFGPQPVFSFRSLDLSTSANNSTVRGKLLELLPPVNGASVDGAGKASQLDNYSKDSLSAADISALTQPASCRIALVVGITPGDALQSNIWVKLCPMDGSDRLPEDLEVRVLDDQDVVVMEAQSRQTDMLQLNFRGMLNEQFAIEVALKGVSLIEKFVI